MHKELNWEQVCTLRNRPMTGCGGGARARIKATADDRMIYFSFLNSHFTSSDPEEWSSGHVQKWLLWTEHLYRLPQVGKAFQHLSGSNLCMMSEEEFRQRCSPCGDVLFAHLDIWKSGRYLRLTTMILYTFTPAVQLSFYVMISFYEHESDSLQSENHVLFISAAWMKDRCSPQTSGFIGKSSFLLLTIYESGLSDSGAQTFKHHLTL